MWNCAYDCEGEGCTVFGLLVAYAIENYILLFAPHFLQLPFTINCVHWNKPSTLFRNSKGFFKNVTWFSIALNMQNEIF